MVITELTAFLREIAKAQVKHEMVRRFLSHPQFYPVIKEEEEFDPTKLVPPSNSPLSEGHPLSLDSTVPF